MLESIYGGTGLREQSHGESFSPSPPTASRGASACSTNGTLPEEGGVSLITAAELLLGVLATDDPSIRAQADAHTSAVETLEPVPVDEAAARAFAEIVTDARRRGRRPRILDPLISAPVASLGVAVYTQDADFDDMAGVAVVRV